MITVEPSSARAEGSWAALVWVGVVIVVGLGVPWLCLHLYNRFVDLPLSWPWIEAIGPALYTTLGGLAVVALMLASRRSLRGLIAGSGKWITPEWFLKLFVILVISGISLDYLWRLPWFILHPLDMADLATPTAAAVADNEERSIIPETLTTFMLLIVGPVVEEVFFRGLLLRALARVMSLPWAIGLSALVFGFFHTPDPLASTAFAVLLSVVYVQSGSLFSSIALHVAYNALIRLLDYASLVFPDWYLSFDLYRVRTWWLHATILLGCAALTVEYARYLRRSTSWPLRMPSV